MQFSSEIEAYAAGFIAARARLSDPLTIIVPIEFKDSLKRISEGIKAMGFKTYYGLSKDKAHLKIADTPEDWLSSTPNPEDISFNHWLAYVRGAFESNGCFTVSNKHVKGKTYSYRRIQFYFREGEEWIADFVRDSWHQWLGSLGMAEGKDLAISEIPAGQGNRTKNTFSFTVSGKKEEVITGYMYHKASVSLLREDLVDAV